MIDNSTIRINSLAVLAQNERRMDFEDFLRETSCRILRHKSMHPAFYNKVRNALLLSLRNSQVEGVEIRSLRVVRDGEPTKKTWVMYTSRSNREGDHIGNVIPFRKRVR